jgi:biopolymer transport protein ExbB/biopolymer transport protein TolQ
MSFLGTLGSNAPFIGLFGTVIGVIEAFHQLGEGANKSAMGNVMSGIAEALVATGVGLFVAIPAVVACNMVQKRIASVESNVATITKQITASLKADVANESRGARHDADDSGPVVRLPNAPPSDSRLAEAE